MGLRTWVKERLFGKPEKLVILQTEAPWKALTPESSHTVEASISGENISLLNYQPKMSFKANNSSMSGLLEVKSKPISQGQQSSTISLITQAKELFKIGEYNQALETLDLAIKYGLSLEESWNLKAQILEKKST